MPSVSMMLVKKKENEQSLYPLILYMYIISKYFKEILVVILMSYRIRGTAHIVSLVCNYFFLFSKHYTQLDINAPTVD